MNKKKKKEVNMNICGWLNIKWREKERGIKKKKTDNNVFEQTHLKYNKKGNKMKKKKEETIGKKKKQIGSAAT